MRKTFRYRIFPTRKQTTVLNQTLGSCCWLYNHLLAKRKIAWASEKKSLSRFTQCNTLKQLKEEQPFLKNAHSQVLQNVSVRIDLAFRAFFKRTKYGGKPGYPRFRSKFRYDSFTYPQSGFKLLKNVVQLSKVGGVKIKLHRPIGGTIKTCTVKRTPTGKWFVSFACDINHKSIEQPIEPVVGIDLGLESFATLSGGERVESPHFFRKEEKALVKAQRKFSKKKKPTQNRTKAHKVVARIHERISNKRHNFVHQLSRKFIERYNTICVEDISINDMQKNNFRCINKSIGDAAWRMFLNLLEYKAEYAGKRVVKINPAYTSQTCSKCGTRHKLKLSNRVYHCPCCNLKLDRDINAAINILRLGMRSLGKDFQPLALKAIGL